MIFSRRVTTSVSLLAATTSCFVASSSTSSASPPLVYEAAPEVTMTIADDKDILFVAGDITTANKSNKNTKRKVEEKGWGGWRYDAAADDADTGILALLPPSSLDDHDGSMIVRGLQATTNFCTDGYVDCSAGYVTDDPDQTPCHQACYDNDLSGYRCCGGTKACDLFTGNICKDKYSCMGEEACYDATIPIVVKSCSGGDKACWKVGRIPACAANTVGNFINSCIGEKSCYQVAYGDRAGSGVGNLINSCTADEACRDMGRDGKGGIVTSDLKDCCTTGRSCFEYGEFNLPDVCKVGGSSKSGKGSKYSGKGDKTKSPARSAKSSKSELIRA